MKLCLKIKLNFNLIKLKSKKIIIIVNWAKIGSKLDKSKKNTALVGHLNNFILTVLH